MYSRDPNFNYLNFKWACCTGKPKPNHEGIGYDLITWWREVDTGNGIGPDSQYV